ncbi:MAG: hypothetical protein ACFFDT_07355, partial [Candidatus Hodarchaeota archaeon]
YNLSMATNIPDPVRTSWQNMLFWISPPGGGPTSPHPTPPDPYFPSIAGLSKGVRDALRALDLLADWADMDPQNVLVQEFIDNMDDIGLATIFGGGS